MVSAFRLTVRTWRRPWGKFASWVVLQSQKTSPTLKAAPKEAVHWTLTVLPTREMEVIAPSPRSTRGTSGGLNAAPWAEANTGNPSVRTFDSGLAPLGVTSTPKPWASIRILPGGSEGPDK